MKSSNWKRKKYYKRKKIRKPKMRACTQLREKGEAQKLMINYFEWRISRGDDDARRFSLNFAPIYEPNHRRDSWLETGNFQWNYPENRAKEPVLYVQDSFSLITYTPRFLGNEKILQHSNYHLRHKHVVYRVSHINCIYRIFLYQNGCRDAVFTTVLFCRLTCQIY